MIERDLGYRRVQCTGRGSYIISLPKEWVQTIGLQRGSEIAFNVQSDSTLILIPRKLAEKLEKTETTKLREYYVVADPEKDSLSVYRMIKALYAIGADIIRIHFKSSKDIEKKKAELKRLARDTFLGSEIVEETPDEITYQILIRHSEFPIEKAFRRMAILALLANKDAISTLKDRKPELFQNVITARNDVNRLALYLVRQLKWGIERNLFRELGFKTPKEFLLYRIAVNEIKSIGENAFNIVNSLATFQKMVDDQTLFMKEPIDDEVYIQLVKFNNLAHEQFDEATRAMFKREYKSAERIISKRKSLVAFENDLISLMASKTLDPNVAAILRLIFDSSRRIMEYSKNIAELTLNRTVEDLCANYAVK